MAIPTQSNAAHNIGNVDQDVRLGLDASATAHIISVLTDLYSDPVKAVVREYSTNALDSHIESGNPEPILVTLPTRDDPFFKVQDFGGGLDMDGIASVYALYGRSTKRDSDEVNGTLGLGCKSALTYSVSFNIAAVKDDEKILATVVKDSDGVGTIKILDRQPTNEPNGVEITIPVRSQDVNRFSLTAADFYRYWKPGTVLVNGAAPKTVWDDPDVLWLDDDVAVDPNASESVIVQHNVAYPLDYKHRFDVNVVAFVPIGSINFTPSREALHYTARTEATFNELKAYVAETLPRRIQEEVAVATTPYAKLRVLANWRSNVGDKFVRSFFGEKGNYVGGLRKARAAWKWSAAGFYGGRGGHRNAAKVERMSFYDLLNDGPLVVGFPNASLSELHRARLEDVYPSGTVHVFPDTADLSWIEGRPNVRTWDSIVAATPHVKLDRKTTKQVTMYPVFQAGHSSRSMSAEDIAEEFDTVLYEVRDTKHVYSVSYLDRVEGLPIVSIRYGQVDKFMRLFPEAQRAHDHMQKLIKEAAAALTAADKFAIQVQHSWSAGGVLKSHTKQIKDASLRKVLTALGHTSPALERFDTVGGNRSQFFLKDSSGYTKTPKEITDLQKSYPLLADLLRSSGSRSASADIVLYLNAKHQSNKSTSKKGN